MNYAEALDHLARLGPELPPTDPASTTPRRKFDLAHMRTLCAALGNPQDKVPSILIAGTNGKGSTAAPLASILNSAGYRTGLYTSPHLVRVNERIQLSHPILPTEYGNAEAHTDGPLALTQIADEDFATLYTQVEEASAPLVSSGDLPHPPSFFERLTAVAFLYFARAHAEIMILEVGLGGRLDATNIVQPLLSIITDIALDHQEWLGNTITEIAGEKAGILRPHGTLITLSQHPEANTAIGVAATALEVTAINAAPYLPPAERNTPDGQSLRDRVGLQPRHSSPSEHGASAPGTSPSSPSEQNRHPERSLTSLLSQAESKGPEAASATHTPSPFPTTDLLPHNRYTLNIDNTPLEVDSPLPGQHQQRNIALALAATIELRNQNSYNLPNPAIEAGIRNTHWPGRLEFVAPNLLLDVAHNPAGAWTLRAAIAALPRDPTENAHLLLPPRQEHHRDVPHPLPALRLNQRRP